MSDYLSMGNYPKGGFKKEETPSSDAALLSLPNSPSLLANLHWREPNALSDAIFLSLRNQILKERVDVTAALAGVVPQSHLPSNAERQRIRAILDSSESYSSHLAEQIQTAKGTLYELEKEMPLDVEQVKAIKRFISSFRFIPDEILGEIFEVYVLEQGCSPWVLMQVSSGFRRAAILTRRIWTKIHLQRPESYRVVRWLRGREICATNTQLTAALGRSGTAPLDIEIASCTEDMAHTLVSEWSRWDSLIYREKTDAVSSILFSREVESRSLNTVDLRCTTNDYFHHWLQLAQPASLSLYMSNVQELDSISWWNGLHEMCIDFSSATICRHITACVLSTITATRQQLTHLELRHIPFDGDSMPLIISFPNLIQLKLTKVAFWWRFKCDRLLKLILVDSSPIPAHITASYPSLVELDYESDGACLHSTNLRAPRLDSLILRKVDDASPGHNFVWLDSNGLPSQITPKRLSMILCSITYKPLLQALIPYENLEALVLTGWRLPFSFFKAFSIAPTTVTPMLCPNLREMAVDMLNAQGKIEEPRFAQVFEDMVKMRSAYGSTMTKLFVTWQLKSRRLAQDFVKNKG